MKFLFILTMILFSSQILASNASQQTYGYYSRGSLKLADQQLDSSFIYQLFPRRKRNYANKVLVDAINAAANEIFTVDQDSERLQVGDFSAKAGGKLNNHNSHQNGLDVDVVYLRYDRGEQPVNRSTLEESFVKNGQVTSNFDVERNWQLIKDLVTNNDVNRIFVDEKIKDLFCERYQDTTDLLVTETLRRMRPWRSHDDHLHLRLKCPESQLHCESQNEPPVGDSCFVKMTLVDEVAP